MAVVTRGIEGKIGHLTTAMVIVLTVISICVFLYVVEHVSKELRPVTVMADIASDGLQVMKAVYPRMFESMVRVKENPTIAAGTQSTDIRPMSTTL